jgi:uncharacterized protein
LATGARNKQRADDRHDRSRRRPQGWVHAVFQPVKGLDDAEQRQAEAADGQQEAECSQRNAHDERVARFPPGAYLRSMADPTITLEQDGERGRYVIALEGGEDAEMTFRKLGNVMRINHTGVPEAYEGQGLARALLDRAIADARAQGFKILPACSYVVAQFRRHAKEWADVIVT